jgi:hypothetical protein
MWDTSSSSLNQTSSGAYYLNWRYSGQHFPVAVPITGTTTEDEVSTAVSTMAPAPVQIANVLVPHIEEYPTQAAQATVVDEDLPTVTIPPPIQVTVFPFQVDELPYTPLFPRLDEPASLGLSTAPAGFLGAWAFTSQPMHKLGLVSGNVQVGNSPVWGAIAHGGAGNYGYGQFCSIALQAQTVLAGNWLVGFAADVTNAAANLNWTPFLSLYLVNGSTGAIRTTIFALAALTGAAANRTTTSELTCYGTIAGAGFTASLGDYLVLELGLRLANTNISGTWIPTSDLYTSGTSLISADNVAASSALSQLFPPQPLQFQSTMIVEGESDWYVTVSAQDPPKFVMKRETTWDEDWTQTPQVEQEEGAALEPPVYGGQKTWPVPVAWQDEDGWVPAPIAPIFDQEEGVLPSPPYDMQQIWPVRPPRQDEDPIGLLENFFIEQEEGAAYQQVKQNVAMVQTVIPDIEDPLQILFVDEEYIPQKNFIQTVVTLSPFTTLEAMDEDPGVSLVNFWRDQEDVLPAQRMLATYTPTVIPFDEDIGYPQVTNCFEQTDTAATDSLAAICSLVGLTAGTTTFSLQCDINGTPGVAADITSQAGTTTNVMTIMFESPVNRPWQAIWPSAPWTVNLSVNASQPVITWNSIYLVRVAKGGGSASIVTSVGGLNIQIAAQTIYSATFLAPSSTGAISDQLAVLLGFNNSAGVARGINFTPSVCIQAPFSGFDQEDLFQPTLAPQKVSNRWFVFMPDSDDTIYIIVIGTPAESWIEPARGINWIEPSRGTVWYERR